MTEQAVKLGHGEVSDARSTADQDHALVARAQRARGELAEAAQISRPSIKGSISRLRDWTPAIDEPKE